MTRIGFRLALCALCGTVLLPGVAGASDGDVDYSAPYITVDPETGELITVNPGPRPVMHDMAAAQERDSGRAQPAGSVDAEAGTNSPQTGAGLFVFVAAVVGLGAAALFALSRRVRRNSGSVPARRS